jgi:hypothetical protein
MNSNFNTKNYSDLSNDDDKLINDSLYVKFRDIPPRNLFIYVAGVLVTLLFAKHLGLNIYLSLILVIGIIFIYISKYSVIKTVHKNNVLDKLDSIYPHPLYFNKYPDLIELFFGLKRIAELNTDAYSRAIYNTDGVIEIYNNILNGASECKGLYDIALDRKKDALNALESFIFEIENDDRIKKKLYDGILTLNVILNSFTRKIKEICNERNRTNDLNIHSGVITNGPVPYNSFDKYEYY